MIFDSCSRGARDQEGSEAGESQTWAHLGKRIRRQEGKNLGEGHKDLLGFPALPGCQENFASIETLDFDQGV